MNPKDMKIAELEAENKRLREQVLDKQREYDKLWVRYVKAGGK